MKGTCAVILADCNNTVEHTTTSRYRAEVLFRPAILWVAEACRQSGAERVCAVLGDDPSGLRKILPEDCVVCAEGDFDGGGEFPRVVFVRGDMPLVDAAAIRAAFSAMPETGSAELSVEGECALIPASCAVLANINEIARARVFQKLWAAGVSIPCRDGVIIGSEVQIGAGTTILPGTILRGKTVVGANCEIGPNSYLDNAVVGDGCRVISTVVDSSRLEGNVRIGPMSNVRPNCAIASGAKVGDFVELKNSTIGAGTSVAHLTYVGDSDVGDGCNVGCGVVTVNYDGSQKYRTTIGNNVFIGCNTNLIAPVTVGDRAYTAAGTTITEDVPPDTLGIGRARQVNKHNWSRDRGLFNKK